MNAAAWPQPVAARRHRAGRPLSATRQQRQNHFASVFVLSLTAGLLFLLLSLQHAGYTSLASLDLWGRTLLAADGAVRAPSIVAAFPTLPYLSAITAQLLAPAFGSAILPMIAALFYALMIAGWFRAFGTEGFGQGFTVLAVLLLGTNPILLRSIADGPGWASFHAGLSMLAIGLFNLRRDHRITDVILVALALPLMILSDPTGLVVCIAAIPFIALSIPVPQMCRSPFGVLLTLLFPAAFILFGFAYTNWIFNDDPWRFLGRFAELRIAPPLPGADFWLALAATVAAAPILPAIIARSRRQRGLRRAALAIGGCALAAILLGWVTTVWVSPLQSAAIAVPLAMAAATRWPRNRPGADLAILAMLALGWLGGGAACWAAPDSESARLRAAIAGAPIAAADAELAALGLALQGQSDILFDAEAAPSAIAHRGGADGISAASTMRFRLAGLRQYSDAQIQVVRDIRSPRGADAMGRTFPQLHASGPPGYRLLHDGPEWRAWIREESP